MNLSSTAAAVLLLPKPRVYRKGSEGQDAGGRR